MEVPTNQLAVMGQDLVKGLVEAKLTGGTLTLPSGTFPKLDLKVETDDSKIAVDVASQDPVLKVKTIDVVTAGKKLTMECPTMWALGNILKHRISGILDKS